MTDPSWRPGCSSTCKFRKSFLVLAFCFAADAAVCQHLNMKIAGDSAKGFSVDVFDGSQLLLSNTEELSLRMANLDLSETADIKSWRASDWTGDERKLRLTRETYVSEFDLSLSIAVTYEIVNENVIKKSVDLFQSGMPSLYYTIDFVEKPAVDPLKYITFEHDDFPGGFAHELFPSAGFVTPGNQVVGFLTDAGYKNHFTRATRRRFNGHGGGFVGMRRLPDPALISVATLAERSRGENFINLRFGEMYNLDAGEEELESTHSTNKAEDSNGLMVLSCTRSALDNLEINTTIESQNVYTISFLSKGTVPLSLKLFRMHDGVKSVELEHGVKYIDKFPTNEEEWTLFKGSVLVPYIGSDSVSLFIGAQSKGECQLQVKDLRVVKHQPQKVPYNIMPMGETVTKNTYIFLETWKSHRDYMIASQLRLAEGLGFEGSAIEKMLYANFNMMTWITSVNDLTPVNVPNINYSPDEYNRDSFLSIVSTYNRKLNLEVWEQWGKTQESSGAIKTIITPYMGTIEAKGNEATIHWLIWAMLNKRRFGVELPEGKIRKAVDFVLSEFDADKDGLAKSHFSLSQIDVIRYPEKTDRLAVNQGLFAVALRTIKELGFDISTDYLSKAEDGYRKFYDVDRKRLLHDRRFPEIISLVDLEPEFLTLWLFDRPMLTDEMVVTHLDQIPILNKVPGSPHPGLGTLAPAIIRLTDDKKGYSYLTAEYQPFEEFGASNYGSRERDGFYYNGGSWFRAEYSAYVVGLRHGWKQAGDLMENRAWAETNLNPDWPVSQEHIPTKSTSTATWWPSARGLSWNVFILMANEVAGLRTPEMDPDYRNR